MRPLNTKPVRFPGEGDLPYGAFTEFLSQGWTVSPGRVPIRVPRDSTPIERKYGPGAVEGWRHQFDWVNRAADYDTAVCLSGSHELGESLTIAKKGLASFVNAAVHPLVSEFERSLKHLRSKGKVIPMVDLVRMGEALARIANSITPKETVGSQPNLGAYPEDALIRGEVLGEVEPQEPTDGPQEPSPGPGEVSEPFAPFELPAHAGEPLEPPPPSEVFR
jgi:hypothetical protein